MHLHLFWRAQVELTWKARLFCVRLKLVLGARRNSMIFRRPLLFLLRLELVMYYSYTILLHVKLKTCPMSNKRGTILEVGNPWASSTVSKKAGV